MSLLPSDMIYRDLKEKGLQLTAPTKVTIPDALPLKSNLIKKISSVFSHPSKKASSPQSIISSQLLVYQVHYSAFIAINENTIFIYKFVFDENNKNIQIVHEGTLCLGYNILNCYTCESIYVQDKDFPVLACIPGGAVYFNYLLKQNTIEQKNVIKLQNILGAGWISDKQCIILNDKNIYHYVIDQGILKLKSLKSSKLLLSQNQKVKKAWILSRIDQQQDSIVSIFYSVISKTENQSTHLHMKLKIKQFVRIPDGDIQDSPSPDFVVETQSLQYSQEFDIMAVGQYYFLQLANEVLVVKKKYEKYRLMDNMMEIMREYKVKLAKKGLVASIGVKGLQLNSIQFNDPKCSSRILDVIQFSQQLKGYHEYYKQIWPIMINKEYTLIFVFQNEKQISLSGLIKLQPMQKMLALAKKAPKQKLQILQDMARNLGIERKDFYLKLWLTSKKQNAQIYQYLLPCKDINTIKKQLKATLRTRTIHVTEMLKILQKIAQLNLQNLQTAINQKNYREYVKNDFLRKKIKLNQMNKELDHRIFDKIYFSSLLNIFVDIVSEELEPVQPKFDPLHFNLNDQPIKQLKSLQNVLQQFKVVLLEEYKTFLIQFLSHFPHKIVDVLSRFNFLLPNHPFQIQVQKPSKINEPILRDPKTNDTQQQLWFKTVTVSEWQAQVTKQRIQKRLLNYFPTSKVTQTVDQFYNSPYGKEFRRWKHGLITADLDEYTKKLKTLSGVQLYLDVCQFANQISIKNDGDPKISQKILSILKQKNGLTERDMHYCKLYANMHYFMIKNKIITKDKIQISYLTSLKPENLVALFFLENKQRKQHIFADFKALYEDKNQFKTILQKFVQSQDCSRIQLEILMKQVKLKGHKFQKQNQDIIQILITGICMKVQIRQNLLLLDVDDDEQQNNEDAPCEIDQIQLNKTLALKVNRIKRLKLCKQICRFFKMQKKTYQQLLDLEKDNNIFKQILKIYFQLRQDHEKQLQKGNPSVLQLLIQDQQPINLQNPRNLLTILIYLQQNVFYSAKTFDILLIFGLELLTWKQFDIIRALVRDYNALEMLQIDRQQYIQNLILRALDNIYLDPDIIYQDQTRQQILNILNIDDQISPLKTRQTAKLDIIAIFKQWTQQFYPADIHTICHVWKESQNRLQFIQQIIDTYITHLTFKSLEQLYRLLQITQKQTTDINIMNKQYIQICDYFANKLLESNRFREAAEIIAYLMDIEQIQVNYNMIAQAYVQGVVELFTQDQEKGRKLIQLFVQKYGTSQSELIKLLLKQYFDTADMVLRAWQIGRMQTILINSHYYYQKSTKFHCQVYYNDLWQMAKKQASNSSQIYFNFFFLAFGLNNPQKGLYQTVGISYNLQKLTNLLMGQLDALMQRDQNLWFVNYNLLQGKFLFDAMLGQAIKSLQISQISQDKQNKYSMIVKQLRSNRNEKNQKILNLLLRLKAQVLNKNKTNSRRERFKMKQRQLLERQKQKRLQQAQIPEEVQDNHGNMPEVFLNWKKVQDQKRYISSTSHVLMSEKQLIDKVFENEPQLSRFKAAPKKSQFTQIPKKKFLQGLFLPSKFMQRNGSQGGQLAYLINNNKYQEVGKYPLSQVFQTIKIIFDQNPERDYREIIQILDALDIGDRQKRDIFRVAKLYLDPLSNQIRRILFPIQFFMTAISSNSEQSKSQLVFEQIKHHIDELSKKISIYDLRQIATMISSILGSADYQALIYLQQLQKIGQNSVFDSSSALLAQECVIGMVNACPDLVSQCYKQLIGKMVADNQMRIFVKQILSKTIGEKQHYTDIAEQIRNYH